VGLGQGEIRRAKCEDFNLSWPPDAFRQRFRLPKEIRYVVSRKKKWNYPTIGIRLAGYGTLPGTQTNLLRNLQNTRKRMMGQY
jgi:hypothetical protein